GWLNRSANRSANRPDLSYVVQPVLRHSASCRATPRKATRRRRCAPRRTARTEVRHKREAHLKTGNNAQRARKTVLKRVKQVLPLVRAAAISSPGAGPEAMGDAPAENMITSAVSTARPAATTPHPGTLQTNQASTGAQPVLAGPDDIFELIVRPLVKQSVRQCDRSGEVYRHDVFTGNFFNSIMEAIWEKYSPIVKHRAVKMNGVWSVETPDIAAWSTVMQFKVEKRLVSPNKNDDGWNEWLEKKKKLELR
ncbi:hypothetical protein L917_03936, partial [Phytophthora nicotianae]